MRVIEIKKVLHKPSESSQVYDGWEIRLRRRMVTRTYFSAQAMVLSWRRVDTGEAAPHAVSKFLTCVLAAVRWGEGKQAALQELATPAGHAGQTARGAPTAVRGEHG